ncbi:hypothetical protein D3C81_2330550 [compost metagenome]
MVAAISLQPGSAIFTVVQSLSARAPRLARLKTTAMMLVDNLLMTASQGDYWAGCG